MNFKQLVTVHCSLITVLLLSSCASSPTPAPQTSLFLYRFDPPAFLEYSADFQPVNEIPFHLPPDCGLYNTFPAPIGRYLLIELSCPGGQTVLFLDPESASVTQPITDSNAHFLAWTSDGKAAYLKINSFGSPQVIRAFTDFTRKNLPINEFTYDLAVNPVNDDFTFTFSRGMGFGSELHSTQYEARHTQLLYADPFNYISFARFSPDGKQIAFIKIPDTQIPFTVGELWLMDADGSNARKLADVDAGHGYAANWSPDGTRIALVVRENPEDEAANRSSEALVSNIHIVNVQTGALTQITNFTNGRVETPFWSPDGNTLTFSAVIDGRMTVSIADVGRIAAQDTVYRDSGEGRSLEAEPACCPAWMRK